MANHASRKRDSYPPVFGVHKVCLTSGCGRPASRVAPSFAKSTALTPPKNRLKPGLVAWILKRALAGAALARWSCAPGC